MKIFKIEGGPVTWIIIVLLFYMAVRDPSTLQGLLVGFGHLLGVVGSGFVKFLNGLGVK
jgi:hypothetical protein